MKNPERMKYIFAALADIAEGQKQKFREFCRSLGKSWEEFDFVAYLSHAFGGQLIILMNLLSRFAKRKNRGKGSFCGW
jgi:hypothetical protein